MKLALCPANSSANLCGRFSHPRRLVLLAVFGILDCFDRAGPRVVSQQFQRLAENLFLQVAPAGPAKAVSDFEAFGIERARRSHLRRDFRANGNQHRRNSFHLDFTLDRDDRAVTDVWSTTSEHNRISARSLVDVVGNLPSSAFVHRFQLHGIAHVADVLFCDATDETFCF